MEENRSVVISIERKLAPIVVKVLSMRKRIQEERLRQIERAMKMIQEA